MAFLPGVANGSGHYLQKVRLLNAGKNLIPIPLEPRLDRYRSGAAIDPRLKTLPLGQKVFQVFADQRPVAFRQPDQGMELVRVILVDFEVLEAHSVH